MHGLLGIGIELILIILFMLNIYHGEVMLATIFIIIFITLLSGFTHVRMHEAKRIDFFGQYIGTLRKQGLAVIVPFSNRKRISLETKPINLELFTSLSPEKKVKIILFYKVVDTAKAVFSDKYVKGMIESQSEIILFSILLQSPSENGNTDQLAILKEMNDAYVNNINQKIKSIGIEVTEANVFIK